MNDRIITKLTLLILLIGFCSVHVQAQLSIKTGYIFNYTNPTQYNKVVQQFNADNTLENQAFSDLHILHGFLLGLRYDWEYLAFEFGWNNKFKNFNTQVSGEEQDLFYRVNSLSFGIENTFNHFGYGASIDLNQTIVKFRETRTGSKRKILNEFNWSTQLYVAINTKGVSAMRLSFRPFIQIPLTKVKLDNFDQELNNGNSTEQESAPVFGLKILFING